MPARPSSRQDYSSLTPSLPQRIASSSQPLQPLTSTSQTLHLLLQLPATTTAPPPSQQHFLHGTFAQGCENGCGTVSAAPCRLCGWVDQLLTISKLKRWSINYYIDPAHAAERAAWDLARAVGALAEYYSERETRTPAVLGRRQPHKHVHVSGVREYSGVVSREPRG